MRHILDRYLFSTIGLFFVALGVSLSALANLGIAPLSALGYVFNLRFPSISFGTFIFIVNFVYMLFQILFYGKDFKANYLLQLVASFVFSAFVDLTMPLIQWIPNETLIQRLVIIIIGSLITAVGISMEVKSNAWMLSAEMTVASFCHRFPKSSFSRVKIAMDCILVVITAVIAFVFFKNPLGLASFTNLSDQLLAKSPGAIIGVGTLIMAFLPGYLIRYISVIINKINFKD